MKQFLLLMAAVCPLMISAQKGKFTVVAKRTSDTGEKAYLYRYTAKMGKKIDTVSVVNGGFTFTGSVEETEMGQIILRDGNSEKSFVFYLEPGTIRVNYPVAAAHAEVSGTPLNKDWQEYRAMINHLTDSLSAINTSQRGVNEFDPKIMGEKTAIIRKFVQSHFASPVSVDLLDQLAVKKQLPDILDPIYNLLSNTMKNSEKGKEVATRITGMRSAIVGNKAPLFTLPDTSGRPLSLADFKGKYVLLDFWATWCGPCMEEMPNVARAYSQYKDKGLEILGVSLDQANAKEKWLNTIRQQHLDWHQVSDLKFWNSQAALLYNINSVPANFLIDPQGKIVATNLRGDALQKKLGELLN